MRKEIYQNRAKHSANFFEFISKSPKGFIKKRIVHEEITIEGLYNLAFGDVKTIRLF